MQMWERTRTWTGRGAVLTAFLVAPSFLVDACEGAPQLETRTFELQHLDPEEAVEMVRPYVYSERDRAPGVVTHFPDGITVRETPEALARVDEVLARYDRAKPGVRLHFQIIEADGFTEADARIADVRSALEELFRFEGYRLVTDARLALMEGTSSQQQVGDGRRDFEIFASVEEVRGRGDSGSVTVTVLLQPTRPARGGLINTTLSVPAGETVILGSTKVRSEPTLILTVRPELVPLPDSGR